MKLPNGFGGVTKLPGTRRKPFQARVTVGWKYDEKRQKMVQDRRSIGTFKTKKEALQALSDYAKNPYDLDNDTVTLSDLYAKWTENYFPTIEDSSRRTVTSAWRYCHGIYSMRVKDVRARHIKGIMEDAYIIQTRGKHAGEKTLASPGTKSRIKSLFNLMFDYALEYELTDRNYARTFDLSNDIVKEKEAATRSHIPFKEHELEALWNALGSVKFVDWVLIQCYMGWRPQELAILRLEDVHIDEAYPYIVGGMKTGAGKNRPVPIHPKILDLVRSNYEYALSLGSEFLLNDPEATKGGMNITYDKYAGRFDKVVKALHLNEEHRPHDPRTTFITKAKKAGIDDFVVKRLCGHKIQDVTESVYTVRDIPWLSEDLRQMP